MCCLIVGQSATVREHLCNYCATRNATVFQTVCGTGPEQQEAIAGGLLIHSDPFALIDLRFFC
jgi:hypothetical protein